MTDTQIERRLDCAAALQDLGHTAKRYFEKVVYTDICNSVLPRAEAKAEEQSLARKGGKGWGSEGAQLSSDCLRGGKESWTLKSTDAERIWCAPVLACGKLHAEVLPEDFSGEDASGAEVLVQKVRAAMHVRFQGGGQAAPKVVWTDRGNGFYDGTGKITTKYKSALHGNDLKPFWQTVGGALARNRCQLASVPANDLHSQCRVEGAARAMHCTHQSLLC